MIRKEQIEGKIDAAMASIDKLAPASPALFFFTRLEARMMREESNFWGRLSRAITRPIVAAASVCSVLLINVFVIMHHTSQASALPERAEIAIADEYSRSNSVYNIDNVQP